MICGQNRDPNGSWSKIGRHNRQQWLNRRNFVLPQPPPFKPFLPHFSDRLLAE